MNETVRNYLAEIDRRGGKVSRRTLDPETARDMVRVREARRAFRRFWAICFWSYPRDLEIRRDDVPGGRPRFAPGRRPRYSSRASCPPPFPWRPRDDRMKPARTVWPSFVASLLLVQAAGPPALLAQPPPTVDVAAVDAIFRAFDNTRSPGCEVGVSYAGKPVLLRAYGMADLEHDVPNTPEMIMEPGSVSKQFTATATILLALDGKLSLDDDVRRYIPELPDYGTPITIRHLLNHTSGLRDWGSVAGIEGWPRTRRAHTHTHVLDILSRQKELNYPPSAYYSYTNSGFNLQAILVSRVSGMSFAEFTRQRIFEPLGMTRTQWRDDFTRVVKDRGIAYRPSGLGQWSMLMPFEDVHGNGGLLTTVEDLLKFTQNLETGAVGGPRYLEEMHRQGVLTSGQVIFYASGLQIGTYKGVREVKHSGSTAGYRGHLARFPDQKVAVAVMCNTSSGNAGQLLYQTADLFLAGAIKDELPAPPAGAIRPNAERLRALAGMYKDTRTGAAMTVAATAEGLRVDGLAVVPTSATRFEAAGGGSTLVFESAPFTDGRPAAVLDRPGQPGVRIEPVAAWAPIAAELAAYVGTYRSDEAEATYTVAVEEGRLVVKDRWGEARKLEPQYADVFEAGGVTIVFRRGAPGRVEGFMWSEGRVWGLRFGRVAG
ncbi:MAG: serine hydrolase [Longimicrobiales bacterium]|nr:serine hydrolase [Longimicrobiales bacterium]